MSARARLLPAAAVALAFVPGVARAVVMEEQVKFDVSSAWVLNRFLNLKTILSYRVKPIGHYIYRDYYYDTPDFAVSSRGYSYRFRVRDKGKGELEYGVQFKREYAVDPAKGFTRLEIDDLIPPEAGRKIAAGAWGDAYPPAPPLRTMKCFREFLEREKIDPSACAPRLFVRQERDRLRLSENGSTYFEISLDTATFNRLGDARREPFTFRQLEFENKTRGGKPAELRKRIGDLIDFFTGYTGVAISRESKYRTAVAHFTKE